MKEMVMTFDEGGNPLNNVTTRDEVHEKELWHEVVHVWIVDERGEVLIQKRSKDKKLYANVWHVSAAGHVSEGETPAITALKETNEELGLNFDEKDLRLIQRVGVQQVVPETGLWDREWINVYLLKVDSSSRFKLQKEEVGEVKWISLDRLESDIKDEVKAKEYLNHPASYYLGTITRIRELLKN